MHAIEQTKTMLFQEHTSIDKSPVYNCKINYILCSMSICKGVYPFGYPNFHCIWIFIELFIINLL